MIRDNLSQILGEELRFLAIKTRERLNLTQKEMSEILQMSESSYSDIETGKNNCGALTAVLLLNIQENPKDFLEAVIEEFQKWYDKERMPIC
ncbi:MAG: helix-turn-helix domain-containing protein [Ruminococcaceae bacterium]|nr:helix-turn-helix domain-containing protein [Oscillospiraceae bacterium]